MKRAGRKSQAQTPAPPKERIYGSKKNPQGSASSKATAKSITFSKSIISVLQDKVKAHNEQYPSKKVSLSDLKAVFRRGAGAYSSSHRPTISGGAPNTRNAWAYARVNKFLKKKAGKEVKKAYVQDDDLLAEGGYLTDKGGLYIIIEEVREENKYKGAYKKIFDIIEEGVNYYNPYGTAYEEIKGKEFHILITPKPDFFVIDKIKKIPKVKIVDQYAEGGEIVWDNKKIKLADGTNTTFDTNNPDIRYKDGGMANIQLPDTQSDYNTLQPILAKQGYQLKPMLKPTKSVDEIAEMHDVSEDYVQEQLAIGTNHEMEHTYSKEVARETALHHLEEDPQYYIHLKEMEMKREASKLEDYYRLGGRVSKETTCEVLDSEGERLIDSESIENMTECLENLPQTKSMHYDYAEEDYKPYRKLLHKNIIYDIKKDLVCVEREQPIAILMGGSPASGKSTFLKKYAPYLLKEEIFKVDADEIRAKLPEYKGYNANQTHLETKDIVSLLLSDRNIGIPCRFDVIYDGTMNNTKSYLPLIELLKNEGYKVFIVYIDKVPKDVIVKRALERYKKSGRFVPLSVIDDFFAKGRSAMEMLKDEVDGYMIIDGSSDNYKIIERGGEELPQNRNYSKIGEPIKITTKEVIKEYKKGGEIDPDDSEIKDIIIHKSGDAGGLLVGRRHSEGGIKAINKSTGQKIEVEGGEIIITRDAVSDETKREFEGEMLTNREILSRINEGGGGVAFAKGGDVPHKCACSGKQYRFGGNLFKDSEIANMIMKGNRMLLGCKYPNLSNSEAFKKLFEDKMGRGGEVYNKKGYVRILDKAIPSMMTFSKMNSDIVSHGVKRAYIEFLKSQYKIHFEKMPHMIQAALLLGNQKLVDKYMDK